MMTARSIDQCLTSLNGLYTIPLTIVKEIAVVQYHEYLQSGLAGLCLH